MPPSYFIVVAYGTVFSTWVALQLWNRRMNSALHLLLSEHIPKHASYLIKQRNNILFNNIQTSFSLQINARMCSLSDDVF